MESVIYFTIQGRTKKENTPCQYSTAGTFIPLSPRGKEARFPTQRKAMSMAKLIIDNPQIDGYCHIIRNEVEGSLIDEKIIAQIDRKSIVDGFKQRS